MPFPEGLDPKSEHDRKKLAFAAHVAKLVADADGVLDMTEISMLMNRFPDALMESFGFVDRKGAFNDTFHAVLTRAKIELPADLSKEEKLELIRFFHRASMVDDEYAPEEERVVKAAAKLLELTDEDIQGFLRKG